VNDSQAPAAAATATASAPSEPYVVELIDVVAGYLPGVNILNGANLTAAKGELIGIIGPNGAGKSTMLKAIFGQVKVRSGAVKLNGEDISGLKANKLVAKGVGFIPQTNNVFPSLTIAENLQMGAFLRKDKAAVAQDMERMLELFPRLKERRAQLAGTMSGGEQQMLAMARGLMARPRLLLLDEPSMGLSPIMVDKIFEVVQDVHQRGMTLLLVEQNASRALSIADRGYVMESGVMTMQGEAGSMLEDPRVRAAYLGE